MFLHLQMSHYHRLLYCLQGKSALVQSSMSKEDALVALVLLTGQDFGYDVAAWEEWFDTNRASLADIYLEVEKKRRDETKPGKKISEIIEEIRQKHKQ